MNRRRRISRCAITLAAAGVAAAWIHFGAASEVYAQPSWHSDFNQATAAGNSAWNSFTRSNQATMQNYGRMMQSARDASDSFARSAFWGNLQRQQNQMRFSNSSLTAPWRISRSYATTTSRPRIFFRSQSRSGGFLARLFGRRR